MAMFNRENLKYTYRWISYNVDNAPFSQPPKKFFNPADGTDVLFIVDRFMSENHLSLASSGQKIERMIKEQLPARKHTLTDVLSWLKRNW